MCWLNGNTSGDFLISKTLKTIRETTLNNRVEFNPVTWHIRKKETNIHTYSKPKSLWTCMFLEENLCKDEQEHTNSKAKPSNCEASVLIAQTAPSKADFKQKPDCKLKPNINFSVTCKMDIKPKMMPDFIVRVGCEKLDTIATGFERKVHDISYYY